MLTLALSLGAVRLLAHRREPEHLLPEGHDGGQGPRQVRAGRGLCVSINMNIISTIIISRRRRSSSSSSDSY